MGKLIGANDLISVCALLDELRAHPLREFVPEFDRLPLESRRAVIKATNGIRSIIEGMPAVEAVPVRCGARLRVVDDEDYLALHGTMRFEEAPTNKDSNEER